MDKFEMGLAYSVIEKVIFSDILPTLTAKGMQAPFTAVGASRNGTAYVFHIARIDAPPEKIVVSSTDNFVKFPVDCLFVDALGAVHRVNIEPRTEPPPAS